MNDEQSENQNNQTPLETSEHPLDGNPQHQEQKPNKFSFLKNKKTLIILGLVLVIAIAIAVFFLTRKKATAPNSVSSKTTVTETTDSFIVNGNTYFKKPTLIKGLVFSPNARCTEGTTCINGIDTVNQSYLIGKTKNNEDIILYRAAGPDINDVILVKKDSKYEIVFPDKEQLYDVYDDNVSTTSTTKLNELAIDKSITIDKQPLATDGLLKAVFISYDDQGNPVIGTPDKGTKLYTKDNIDYYVKKEDKGSYTVNRITAYFKDLISYNVTLAGEVGAKDSKAAENIKWSKGEQTSATYITGGAGCGSGSSYVAAEVQKSDLTEVGKTPQGQIVYRLDPSHPIANEIYTKDYDKGINLNDAAYKNLTVQQFNDKHGYFLIENGFGEYVVYINENFVVRGGCAKPVVYLYPKTDTNVSVSVGAKVTVSDPIYPSGGWKNVLARPNGQLRYQGKEYNSLFWEGQGNGAYPIITKGTIVTQKNMLATIETQLAQQGLRGREVSDFMDFWKPNLPKDPYVRLTWLTPSEINELAPLQISPRPNTTIRVFLDFEGMSKPINLPAQTFKTPKREGFTVVEWGGLARKGLNALVR